MSDAPQTQCETCGEFVPTDEAKLVEKPGATLAFCSNCAQPTRSQELGLGL